MKTFFRSIIKWVFIIIIPAVVITTCINYFYTFGWNGWSMALLWGIVVFITVLNALFYGSNLSSTKFLPFKVKFEYIPTIGFLIGVTPKRPWELFIVIPFCAIEISKRK